LETLKAPRVTVKKAISNVGDVLRSYRQPIISPVPSIKTQPAPVQRFTQNRIVNPIQKRIVTPVINRAADIQETIQSPTKRIKLGQDFQYNSSDNNLLKAGKVGGNLVKGFGESIINEPLKQGSDLVGLYKKARGDKKVFTPSSGLFSLSDQLAQYSQGLNPLTGIGTKGQGKWNVPFTDVNIPDFGVSEAPITGTLKGASKALEPIFATYGATKGLVQSAMYLGFSGLVGGAGESLSGGDFKEGAMRTVTEQAGKAPVAGGFLKATNPLTVLPQATYLNLPARSSLNVLQGVAYDESVGLETTPESIAIDALLPVAGDGVSAIARQVFKSSKEAVNAGRMQIKKMLGKPLQNAKGRFVSAEKFIEGTRPYIKRNVAVGLFAGIEPYQDEQGNWKVRYNPENAAMVMGGIQAVKSGKLRKMRDLPSKTPELPKATQDTLNIGKDLGAIPNPFKKGKSPEIIKDVERLVNNVDPKNVQKKVNLLDYLRTPERVLQKIGLGNTAQKIRQADEVYKSNLGTEINKVNEWVKRVPDKGAETRIFKWLDGQSDVELKGEELKVAKEIKGYLEDWADRLDIPYEGRIQNYITRLFEDQLIQKEFDPDLAKIISENVPGSVYNPFLLKRYGVSGYKENVWEALDAYVKRATRKEAMDPALEQLQRDANKLDLESFNYVKKLGDRINLRPTEVDSLLDNLIKSSPIGYRAGQRPVASITRTWRNMIYRGTLGLNVGSALRNLTQGMNTYAKLGEKYTFKGYAQLSRKLATNDLEELKRVGVLEDNIVQDRTRTVMKGFKEKSENALWFFFDLAEKINRGSAYYGAKARALEQGLDEKQAIEAGKKMVRDTQFTFGAIDKPIATSGDINSTLFQLQNFNIKQTEFLVDMVKNKEIGGMVRFIGASLFLSQTMGKLFGMTWTEGIPWVETLTGERRFTTPTGEILSTAKDLLSTDEDKRAAGLRKAPRMGALLVPAGVQARKTYTGLEDYFRGSQDTPTGKVRFPVKQDTISGIRAGIFGTSPSDEARTYYDEKLSPLGDKQSERFKELLSRDPQQARDYYDSIIQSRKDKKEPSGGFWSKLFKTNEVGAVEIVPLPTDFETLTDLYKSSVSDIKSKEKELRLLPYSGLSKAEQDAKRTEIEMDLELSKSMMERIKSEKPQELFEIEIATYKTGGGQKVEDRGDWVMSKLRETKTVEEVQELINLLWDEEVITSGKKGVAQYITDKYGINVWKYTGTKSSGTKKPKKVTPVEIKLPANKGPIKIRRPQIREATDYASQLKNL